MEKIRVKINGNDVEFESDLSMQSLIEQRKITGSMFVIEKNKQVVQKENYSTTMVKNGDVLEIVGFFGGG